MTRLLNKTSKKVVRQGKHKRVRKRISGTREIPRLCVYKSLYNLYTQVIDDDKGVTLVAASTAEPGIKELPSKANMEAAKILGKRIAEKALEKNITRVVFDRNGYKYHGLVAAIAEAARENGLQF